MSLIRTSFRIHDPNPLNSKSPESGSKFTVDPQSAEFSKSANPLRLSPKSAIRALFEAKSVDPPTYSPPPFRAVLIFNVRFDVVSMQRNDITTTLNLKIVRNGHGWLPNSGAPDDGFLPNALNAVLGYLECF